MKLQLCSCCTRRKVQNNKIVPEVVGNEIDQNISEGIHNSDECEENECEGMHNSSFQIDLENPIKLDQNLSNQNHNRVFI